MGFFDGYNIATSGMSAQRTRINVVSSNLANAQTTHTQEGGPYKRQTVTFQEVLLNQNNTRKDLTKKENALLPKGVKVSSIQDSDDEPIMKYDPTHPDANEDGYVAYPNINPVIEMVELMEAMRSYEANVSAFKTQKDIDTKTLDIIRT